LPPRPDSAALVALAEQHPRHVASGQRIRFVPPQDDGKAYECRIWERGEVETRPDNWHDFFNALVWLPFRTPRTPSAPPMCGPCSSRANSAAGCATR
jgi:hypothetical protein